MKTSQAGLSALEVREGVKLEAYKDTKGIWTIGVGHTGPEVVEGLVWTLGQVREAFAKDILWAETAVNKVVVKLSVNQFDALVSFVFNIGSIAFAKSTMLKVLNLGNFKEAARQFDRWNIPKEIVGRRTSEKNQFLS